MGSRMGRRRRNPPKSAIFKEISLTQVFKRHAEIGCIAASLGPKNKMEKYLRQAGINLPANIPSEEWDPFHDFIVFPT
jgi:hypothetical protein